MPRSQNNEVAGGFTHWAIIDHDKVINEASTSAGATVSPIAIPAGGVVKDVCLHVLKRWTSGSVSNLATTVGDGTDPDGYVVSYDIYETNASTGGTKYNDGVYIDTEKGKIYDSADTIDVTLTATGGHINTLTGGELFIGANILDPATYKKS